MRVTILTPHPPSPSLTSQHQYYNSGEIVG